MSKGSDQLAGLVAPILGDGERHLSTARVSYNGTVPANAFTIDASISSVDPSAPELAAGAVEPDVMAYFPTANQMAIALTDRRLFVWSLGFSGKPKQFVGSVPMVAIAGAQHRDGSYGSVLRVTMRSGAVVDLEFLKGEPAEAFTAALMGQLEAPPPAVP